MGELFGTDGVRGEANTVLSPELAFKVGKAGAHFLAQGQSNKKVLIGKDTRVSGDMLEAALTAGITSLGIDVVEVGVVPTPAVAYLTREEDVAAGIMISASHNPVQDNGIKFFNGDGIKLTDQEEEEIEDIIFNTWEQLPTISGAEVGKKKEFNGALDKYVNYLKTTVNHDFSGLKVVVDAANGAAYDAAPRVLAELGAEVVALNDQLEGQKINVDCGSTAPEKLQEVVVEENADLGIAHDGDADRVIAVDETGELVDGDYILSICGRYLINHNQLPQDTIVVTKYSNLGLHQAMKEAGGKVEVTKNGDRYVLAAMRENGYSLGGEKSGHIIFLDYNTTGDGILTALHLLEIMKDTGQKISQLKDQMRELPQLLVNVEVDDKVWEDNQAINDAIKEVEEVLADNGRIFVRASGTEPVIRIMVEGEDKAELEKLANSVAEVVEEQLTK
ncbi:phosphoglucosamine mutase [Halanaerobacter jeridensis]|uniref:Phosphoglucosamine mutase n=1 Tax=Halanaerobacter jeridensis TaxID=706427 RepID=A0A939BRV2_9FIRM|nr:phosphoglucosamine mutase [Halanaerobacter jeridensis]